MANWSTKGASPSSAGDHRQCRADARGDRERFRVPAISVCGADDWLGEWTFALPQGSMTDEPIYWAHLIAKQGHRSVGLIIEQSLIGESYARNFRKAAREQGLRIVAEQQIAQTAQDVGEAVRQAS
jgi:hypothetical protein